MKPGPDGRDLVNVEANLTAHAVLGAAVAQATGGSALAGASGGVAGEYIAQQLYPDSAVTGALAGEKAVENNSLSGDNAR